MYSIPIVMLNYRAFLSMLHASPLQHEQNNTALSSFQFFHHTKLLLQFIMYFCDSQHTYYLILERESPTNNLCDNSFSSNKQLPTESCFFDIMMHASLTLTFDSSFCRCSIKSIRSTSVLQPGTSYCCTDC